MTSKELNCQQVRWAQFLSDYNFDLVHSPGKENVVADALSRRAQDELDMGDRATQNQCLLLPKRFVQKATTPSVINKEMFVKSITSNNYVHERLIDAFYESTPVTNFIMK